jgi:hypothetical protein
MNHQTGFKLVLGSSGHSTFLSFRFSRSIKVRWTSPLCLEMKNFAMAKKIRSKSKFLRKHRNQVWNANSVCEFGIELGM